MRNQSIRTELVNKNVKTVIITIIQIFKRLSTDVKKVFFKKNKNTQIELQMKTATSEMKNKQMGLIVD